MLSSHDLFEILQRKSITVHFQPILSLKNHSVIGYEGLSRGIGLRGGETIPPLILFEAAKRENRLVDLDRLCREAVFEVYKCIQSRDKDSLLFLNLESSLLDTVPPGNGYLLEQVIGRKIDPTNVVIEIIESKVNNVANLVEFVDFYRPRGFLIALDDVGSGYSNFDRIAAIKPDIIKIDRSIVKDLDKDYYKQEVFKSLGNLARKTGAIVLSEGVETEEELMWAMELNADFAQGYFLARPQPYNVGIAESAKGVMSQIKDHFKHLKVRRIESARKRHQAYDNTVKYIVEKLTKSETDMFSGLLQEIINEFSYVEALYILDERGIQCTDTVINGSVNVSRRKIFQSAKRGNDLSLKEYFYVLTDSGLPKYTTDSYISLATGNLCRTIATTFNGFDGRSYVLCVDILEAGDSSGLIV
jgi:EAL domain-containing protein (putative c-di-GMP-specific phosphodiesterase class I)